MEPRITIKLHSSSIAVSTDSTSRPLLYEPNIASLVDIIDKYKPTVIHTERPFQTPNASPQIYYLFQLFGALKALTHIYAIELRAHSISDARDEVFGNSYISKDFALTQANNMWQTAHDPTLKPTHELVMLDCYTLAKAYAR